MDGLSEVSHAIVGMSERAPPWAVATALIMATGAALIWALTHLGAKLGMFSRDVIGAGATPGQVQRITTDVVERKINGNFGDIKDQLAALQLELVTQRRENDKRHADNQREFGQLQGQLAGRARRV